MIQIEKTVLNIGVKEPVRLLHITDVHICEVSELDEPWQQELMKERIGVFQREANFPEKTPEKEAPKHRLTPEEKKIKDAVMDTLKAQIAYSNDGMRATYKASDQSHKIMAQNKVKIEGNTVTQNGEPMFAIHRRHSAKKTQGCYRELTPTLEYIKKEKAQETKHEKPSIREQLKAAKAQSEKKAPTQEKKPKSKEMEI